MFIETSVIMGLIGALTGGGFVGLLRVRARNRRDEAASAEVLARAYNILIEDLQEASRRQEEEIKTLREEFREGVASKDREIAALRMDLANERAESARLRERVAELEAQVRRLSAR